MEPGLVSPRRHGHAQPDQQQPVAISEWPGSSTIFGPLPAGQHAEPLQAASVPIEKLESIHQPHLNVALPSSELQSLVIRAEAADVEHDLSVRLQHPCSAQDSSAGDEEVGQRDASDAQGLGIGRVTVGQQQAGVQEQCSEGDSTGDGPGSTHRGWQQAWDNSWSCWYYYNEALQVTFPSA